MKVLLCGLLMIFGSIVQGQEVPELVWSEGQGSFGINQIERSPDGNYLAVFEWPLDIRRTSTLQQVKEVWAATTTGAYVYSAHSQWLMKASGEGIRFYLPLLGLQTGILKATANNEMRVAATVVNGNQALVANGGTELALWARVGGIWIRQYQWTPPSGWFDSELVISPDRTRLAVAATGDRILIYDLVNYSQTPTAELSFPGPVYYHGLKFTRDSAHLLALNGPLRVWRTDNWSIVRDIHPANPYETFEPSLNATEIWVGRGTSPGELTRIDLEGNTVWSSVVTKGLPMGLTQLADGSLVFSGFYGLSKLTTQYKIEHAPGARGDIVSIATTSNNQSVATVGWDGHLHSHWRATGLPIMSVQTDDNRATIVRAVPDGLRWIVRDDDYSSVHGNNSIKVFDLAGNQVSPPGIGTSGSGMDVNPTAHPTHGLIAAAAHGATIKILKLSNYSYVANLGFTTNVGQIAFAPDGSRMAAADANGVFRVYRVADWSLEHQVTLADLPDSIAFDHTASRLYHKAGGVIRVMKRTGSVWSTDGTIGSGDYLAFGISRDSRVLAASSYEKIELFYLPTRTLMKTWAASWLSASGLLFSVSNDILFFSRGPTLYAAKNPYPAFISSMSVTPTSIQPGQSSVLRVNITKPAPAGGLTIQLTDFTPNVWTPATIKIPAGQYTATTNLLTLPASKPGVYTIVGTVFGASVSTKLTVAP